ncbi:type VI secretion system baseplate subunit TssF [Arenibaculum sp.]|uniref:type VI secretion system baseplate subunit TssF n=1 Tax=Arenibaculum sp. TaxID=2865862 RepID=UPI002E135E2E|nr:type VI secretion system baseplate subunit TssF [Arenibaculum sp.]
MSDADRDDLLEYYQRELLYLRNQGAEFAARYPKIANRLELSADESPDPHVERLIESFAFLTGRIQRNLDADFPEIPSALLEVLYPQLVAPVPSMAIVQFDVDPDQARAVAGFTIPDDVPLFAEADHGLTCRFQTCYPVELWPIEVVSAALLDPAAFGFLEDRPDVGSVLRLRVSCLGNLTFADVTPERLRFHIDADTMLGGTLYEMLFNQTRGVAVMGVGEKAPGRLLPADAIQAVGFAPDDDVLPYPRHAHHGYRLIQEYFAFPEKFLYFDVVGLGGLGSRREADLLFLLGPGTRRRLPMDRAAFRLNCVPVINLFPKTSEPVRLDQTQVEYRLLPDSRWERSTEIHSIVKVSATSAFEDDSRLFRPYFSYDHQSALTGQRAFWIARRRQTQRADMGGTDMFLAFRDLDFRPTRPPTHMVFAHTLCTNRGLAQQIPPGARFQIEVDAPVRSIVCLNKPTDEVMPPMRGDTLWRLVSNLSLNHLSLSEGRDGLAALHEILTLYAGPGGATAAQQIAGVRGLSSRRVVRRIGNEAWRGFCRGWEVTLDFDESLYAGSNPFLLAAVLDRFIGLYASLESFTQLVITSRQRDGIWKTWPPRAGERVVL